MCPNNKEYNYNISKYGIESSLKSGNPNSSPEDDMRAFHYLSQENQNDRHVQAHHRLGLSRVKERETSLPQMKHFL